MSLLGLDLHKKAAPNPDYAAGGEQPGPHAAARMAADQRHADAAELAANATTAPPTMPAEEAPQLVRQVRTGNPEWAPETFALQPGEVVEIVGREGTRDTFDIVNQSSALNGGTPVALALVRERRDADRLAAGGVFRGPGRRVYLPDGAGRTMTHGAPVFAVADPAATVTAFVDVAVEYGPQYGHPYGNHRAHR